MKTLHLIRHAKSSWDDPELADIHRPLNKRGLNSCQVMATEMLKAGWRTKHIFASPATRVQQTLKNLDLAMPGQNLSWVTDESLYTFSWRDLFDWCQQLPADMDEVTLVGHNPALTEFNNRISRDKLVNIATCAYVQLQLHLDNWQVLGPDCGESRAFLKPKMFL